jgi:hypothetical protein
MARSIPAWAASGDLIQWPASQAQSLWKYNLGEGGNDVQIQKLAGHYGYPDCRDDGN